MISFIYLLRVSIATDRPYAEHYNTLIAKRRAVTFYVEYVQTIAGYRY